jgi:hypothetical protein
MTPTPDKTKLERAEKLAADADVEHEKGNHVFADEIARSAHHLRMEVQQERKNAAVNPLQP